MIDIVLEGPIGPAPGETSAAMVKQQLSRAGGQPITARIHSEGGSVFEGFAIHDAFAAYPGEKRCLVESAAFSIASIVAMAFPTREITENGYFMLHDPTWDDGNDPPPVIEQVRKRMVAIYAGVARASKSAIEAMMAAETFLDASQAISTGLATAIAPATPRAIARSKALMRSHSGYSAAIVARSSDPLTQWKAAVRAEMAKGLSQLHAMSKVEREHPGLRQRLIETANRR